MNTDEIRNDDENMDDDLRDKFEEMMASGHVGKCPNLTHLPNEEKDSIIKSAMEGAMNALMQLYISLGVTGEAILGTGDLVSGLKFKMHFKVYKPGDDDSDFDPRNK